MMCSTLRCTSGYDFGVKTARGDIRIPTVIIHPNFRKNIRKRKRFTKANVLERDGFTCQYTGMKLTKATATIDHVVPRSKGGKTSWDNCVASHISVNNKKGDKSNAEAGLKLIKKPVEPDGGLMYQELVTKFKVRHHDWEYFLKAFEK
jgi:5-methylcytosine-specific restriction endonuclease McrA